jgi:hypothetical protein
MKTLIITLLIMLSAPALATDCTNPETGQVIRIPKGEVCPFGMYLRLCVSASHT